VSPASSGSSARPATTRWHDCSPAIRPAPHKVKDRKPIDDLAKQTNVKPVDRVKAYAQIAGTAAVNMDPAAVSDSGLVKDGLNLVSLKQASEVPAKTDFVDSAGRASGGAPPETATGVAILVNSTASRFEDEDYMSTRR
jgi:hypothetical protein